MVKEGLRFYAGRYPDMKEIFDGIEIYNGDNLDFLKSCASQSYDVVYFDFMFDNPIKKAIGLQVIRDYAAKDEMTYEHIKEALRAARKSVIVKCDEAGMNRLPRMDLKY